MAADVYKIDLSITYTPGLVPSANKPRSFDPDELQVTMVGTDSVDDTQDIPTSNTAITQGEITTLGLVAFTNLDPTNFVEIGLTSSYAVKLLPGQSCAFPAAAALFALADTATVKIRKFLLEL